MSSKFRHIELRGNAQQRGGQHGEQLREEIAKAWDWYGNHFFAANGLSNALLESYGKKSLKSIEDFNSDYRVEMDAIARAAGVEAWKLAVVNARTELANLPHSERGTSPAECTVTYFQDNRVVGQNWDWFEEAFDWTVTIDLERPDGHCIVMICEAGTLAKQGMNNRGLGLCFNFLEWPHDVAGVPFHTILRACLDSKDITEARAAVARAGRGQASHLCLTDVDGNYTSIEFGNGQQFPLHTQEGFLAHTNHYVPEDAKGFPVIGASNSRGRLKTANRRCTERQDNLDIDAMMAVLLDEGDVDAPDGPLCIPFKPLPEENNFPEGTTATLVIDLPGGQFHVKKGCGRERDFETFDVGTFEK